MALVPADLGNRCVGAKNASSVGISHLTFNSQKWLTRNFFPKYPYIIQQTGNENTPAYQVEVFNLIKHQILVTILQEIV